MLNQTCHARHPGPREARPECKLKRESRGERRARLPLTRYSPAKPAIVRKICGGGPLKRQLGFSAPDARVLYQAICAGLCLFATCGVAAAVQYTTFDPQGSICTFAEAVNGSDAVAGYYKDHNNLYHGFVRAPDGTLSEFDPQGSVETTASGIDSKGAVTGFFIDSNSDIHGYLRSPGGKITVFDPPESTGTEPAGISGGIIAGWYFHGNGLQSGFLRAPDGTFTAFDVPNWYATFAVAVTAGGETTGYAWDGDAGFQAFVRTTDGTITTFDVGINAKPLGINGNGTIVGNYWGNNAEHGFLRAPDGTITSFDVPACTNPYVPGIDAKGDVTGYCSSGSAVEGFVRSAAGKIKLFNPPGSIGTDPTGIARISGGAAITGSYDSGNCHGFLRTN